MSEKMTTEIREKEVVDMLEVQRLLRNGPNDVGNFMRYERYLQRK